MYVIGCKVFVAGTINQAKGGGDSRSPILIPDRRWYLYRYRFI